DAVETFLRFDGDFLRLFAALGDDDFRRPAIARGDPRLGDENVSFAAVDAKNVFLVHLHAGGELAEGVAGEFDRCDRVLSDAGFAEFSDGFELDWLFERLSVGRAGDQPRDAHGIASDIENPAAGEFVARQPRAFVERDGPLEA